MNTVAFSARQLFDFLLLVGSGEIETGAIATRIHLDFAQLYGFMSFRYHLVDSLAAVEAPILIHIAELHRLTDLDGTGVRFVLSDDHVKQRCLTGAIRTDHPDDPAFGQGEADVLIQ